MGDVIINGDSTLKVITDAIKAKTDNLPTDPADASDIAASFTVTDGKIDTTMPDTEDGLSFTAIPDMALATEVAKKKEGIRIIVVITFDGGAGSGAVGVVDLLTITGGVDISLEAFCTTLLTEAGATATIEVGIAGNTAFIIAQTDAVDIDANEIWHDATPDSTIELTSDASKEVTVYGSDIIITIGAQNVTAGVIVFSVIYTPRTSGASVVAA